MENKVVVAGREEKEFGEGKKRRSAFQKKKGRGRLSLGHPDSSEIYTKTYREAC